MNGIDLSTELRRKVAVDAEKYPVERSRGSNLKYDELRLYPRVDVSVRGLIPKGFCQSLNNE